MKRVELESFLKSFLLFLFSMGTLIGTIYFINHTQETHQLDETLFNEMRLCSFTLDCPKYAIDFVEKKEQELYTLTKREEGLFSYYPVTNATQNLIEISYAKTLYEKELKRVFDATLREFFLAMSAVFLFSILFALYTLYPLRNALRLTQEFVKDILHDFNTPLSTLRLNASMLAKEGIQNNKIERIQKSVATILHLQANLRLYLENTPLQKEEFDIGALIDERLQEIAMNYKELRLENRVKNKRLFTNRGAFVRILDNLLINAAKYNTKEGSIEVYLEGENTLCIKDSGKGIKNPSKIFDRFYKEHERGLGIGLHIVKKLSTELGMKLRVESKLGAGSTFYLKFV